MAVCSACNATGEVVGMSGSPKPCPRCNYPIITARREARERKRFAGYALKDSMASGTAHLVLLVMAIHADANGVARLPVQKLAKLCRLGTSTTRAKLIELVSMGELIQSAKPNGRTNCGEYLLRVILDKQG